MLANIKTIAWIIGAAIVASLLIIWVVYFRTAEQEVQPPAQSLGQGSNIVPVSPSGSEEGEALPVVQSGAEGKIFKIHEGPIAGVALLQTVRPTTTVARFISQNNGHTFDLALDSPGAIPKAISNTTVPGIAHVAWGLNGRTALITYVEDRAVKTASFSFPAAGTPTTTPVRLQFLPAGITSATLSPDGTRAAYVLRGANGAEGYVADSNGGNPRRAFSLPLAQVSISWPTQSTLLAVSAPAAGVGGIAFSINASTGAVSPLLFAEGLTAIANNTFGTVIYQTAGGAKTTYAYDTKTTLSRPLSLTPLPEQCVWGKVLLYCIVALQYTEPNYIDLVNRGLASVNSGIAVFNTKDGRTALLAAPAEDGAEEADISEIALSPDESYLLYIRKGDRSLWGVRLK